MKKLHCKCFVKMNREIAKFAARRQPNRKKKKKRSTLKEKKLLKFLHCFTVCVRVRSEWIEFFCFCRLLFSIDSEPIQPSSNVWDTLCMPACTSPFLFCNEQIAFSLSLFLSVSFVFIWFHVHKNDRIEESVVHANTPYLYIQNEHNNNTQQIAPNKCHIFLFHLQYAQHNICVLWVACAGECEWHLNLWMTDNGLRELRKKKMYTNIHTYRQWWVAFHFFFCQSFSFVGATTKFVRKIGIDFPLGEEHSDAMLSTDMIWVIFLTWNVFFFLQLLLIFLSDFLRFAKGNNFLNGRSICYTNWKPQFTISLTPTRKHTPHTQWKWLNKTQNKVQKINLKEKKKSTWNELRVVEKMVEWTKWLAC